MGDEARTDQTASVAAGRAVLWVRPTFWKSALVIAPLAGAALFIATGTHAQTSGSATPTVTTTANGPVAPNATPEAARRKGPKVRVKEAVDTSRVANPSTATEPTADAPVAPIDAPEAARTGRPTIKEKEATGRVANPALAAEPVSAPEAARTGGRPKERDDDARDTSRTGRPKERDPTPTNDRVANPATEPAATTPNPSGERAIRKNAVPKATSRGSNLLLPALGGAAAIVAIVAATSGNDRPSSP